MISRDVETRALDETPSMSTSTKIIDKAVRNKIWIDLDNSPHVPFFLPILEDCVGGSIKFLLRQKLLPSV